jgi:hypothetical protein
MSMGFVTTPNPHPMDPYRPDLNLRPAPIMAVAVRHRNLDGKAPLRAFLDIGADRSILAPWSLAMLKEAIGPMPYGLRKVGQGLCRFYDLGFSFDGGGHWFYPDTPYPDIPGVEYAANRGRYPWDEDMLVGRDLLWQFEFCCGGPDSTFSLKHPQHC